MALKITNRSFPDSEFDFDSLCSMELVDSQTGKKIKNNARVNLFWDELNLYVFFSIIDDHIWGTYKNDDDPIWEEEVVELFLGFGSDTPKEYFELQFSPLLVKYDAWVKNPTGNRSDKDFTVDKAWNIDGLTYRIKTSAQPHQSKEGMAPRGSWQVFIKISSSSIKEGQFKKGDKFRGNLFRIDGFPKQSSFQSLKPNFKKFPDFHTPENFETFELV